MSASREKIEVYLQNHPRATVDEISDRLSRTRADIRHHLHQMIQEGLVVVVGKQDEGMRGRPAFTYSLARDNLEQLSHILLTQLLSGVPAEMKQEILRHLANTLIPQEALKEMGEDGLIKKIGKGMRVLNRYHYQARWEARADGPHIQFRHCPYAAILSNHPELCQVDAFILEKLLSSPVKQIARQGIADAPACIFIAYITGKYELDL